MNNNGEELAYPHTENDTYQGVEITNNHFGFTKREAFAMAAMQGLLAANATYNGKTDDNESLSRNAIQVADALLAELEK